MSLATRLGLARIRDDGRRVHRGTNMQRSAKDPMVPSIVHAYLSAPGTPTLGARMAFGRLPASVQKAYSVLEEEAEKQRDVSPVRRAAASHSTAVHRAFSISLAHLRGSLLLRRQRREGQGRAVRRADHELVSTGRNILDEHKHDLEVDSRCSHAGRPKEAHERSELEPPRTLTLPLTRRIAPTTVTPLSHRGRGWPIADDSPRYESDAGHTFAKHERDPHWRFGWHSAQPWNCAKLI
ncbi:hypothetical protein LshimejAT787_0410760 [Lyophyllum shimeji]|uniref:Uncharacterized protein n=1 Tax=Lyophyllum shimeji TaxID=47721 RepID=A0A9P3PKM4_LYOSH|nr:hypothetical protein LshimejAT787_0410760 [Lyophyllum shimeji]